MGISINAIGWLCRDSILVAVIVDHISDGEPYWTYSKIRDTWVGSGPRLHQDPVSLLPLNPFVT